jgi:hypothetical protein
MRFFTKNEASIRTKCCSSVDKCWYIRTQWLSDGHNTVEADVVQTVCIEPDLVVCLISMFYVSEVKTCVSVNAWSFSSHYWMNITLKCLL